ncbi:hypothetical protein LSH36_1544g00011 [Paralvinella palmiformis]|uniref:Uncharacterized protein n=1 Tax=Paralvinella palmiformis TaxID=53620 RepID=A0AAD9ISW7_9ANNE|nr:hypothetical protein LSH36_1544g00011 [Paralvinella palmiformis]
MRHVFRLVGENRNTKLEVAEEIGIQQLLPSHHDQFLLPTRHFELWPKSKHPNDRLMKKEIRTNVLRIPKKVTEFTANKKAARAAAEFSE